MNVDTLSKLVQDKTGISKENADAAVRLVLEKVKEQLPAPAQGFVDQMLGQQSADAGAGAAGMLGKLMGG